MTDDPFIGTWQLDADQTDYQLGEPPAAGTYTITALEDGRLRFTIDWQTQEGKRLQAHYEATPDGEQHPTANSDIADAMSMTRVDDTTLDSAAFKDGNRIAYARRTVDGDTLRIEQIAIDAAGTEYVNASVYTRT